MSVLYWAQWPGGSSARDSSLKLRKGHERLDRRHPVRLQRSQTVEDLDRDGVRTRNGEGRLGWGRDARDTSTRHVGHPVSPRPARAGRGGTAHADLGRDVVRFEVTQDVLGARDDLRREPRHPGHLDPVAVVRPARDERAQEDDAAVVLLHPDAVALDPSEPVRQGVTNPFFFPLGGGGDGVLAHPSYVDDIEDDDDRINKVEERETARTFDGLTSNYDTDVYKGPTSPIPVIRNAELVLLRAEANAQLGDTDDAIDDIDVIRNAASLDDYDGDDDGDSVIDEVLRQRRYELYAEGHRWLDLRRYGRLDTLPIDRPSDDVFDRFPLPESETNDPNA